MGIGTFGNRKNRLAPNAAVITSQLVDIVTKYSPILIDSTDLLTPIHPLETTTKSQTYLRNSSRHMRFNIAEVAKSTVKCRVETDRKSVILQTKTASVRLNTFRCTFVEVRRVLSDDLQI